MSTSTAATPAPAAPTPAKQHRRRAKSRSSLLAHGLPLVWLNGGALAVCLLMIVGLLGLVFYQGIITFWPGPVIEVQTLEGKTYMGEVIREETFRPEPSVIAGMHADALALKAAVGLCAAEPSVSAQRQAEVQARAQAALDKHQGVSTRRLINTANFDLTQTHHNWVSDFEMARETRPQWALVVERATNDGRFYGFPKAFLLDGEVVATEPAEVWAKVKEHHAEAVKGVAQRVKLSKNELGRINARKETARLKRRQMELRYGKTSPQTAAAAQEEKTLTETLAPEETRISDEIAALSKDENKYQLKLVSADGQEKLLPLADVVRIYPANQLGFFGKLTVYLSRWWEFLTDDPRNANSEGGVLPAILGTAAMTVLMSLVVVPFGVIAALYLREYAKAGFTVSAVRIAVNNLAGVPSIVFGVFGLGFFCYFIGGKIDETFFSAKLPSPTFGTGGLLWAALTLALLTVPVVIVATEEALAAVPRSMREGSYACGASKWQTIWRIVLPRAMPGILTGAILAMARGAGEVAPLMLVGAVKVAPAALVDTVFPYVHADRSFMHLGFHIYDVGFQSQDSESAKPMVFTTTMLLVVLITALNLAAMWIRSRLRKKYAVGQF